MTKGLVTILHIIAGAGAVASALHLGGTKTGAALVAVAALANALMPSPIAETKKEKKLL